VDALTDVQGILTDHEVGDVVTLSIQRAGRVLKVPVTLQAIN